MYLYSFKSHIELYLCSLKMKTKLVQKPCKSFNKFSNINENEITQFILDLKQGLLVFDNSFKNHTNLKIVSLNS